MDTVVLLSSASTVDQLWALLEEALSEFEPDFKLQREQPDKQKVIQDQINVATHHGLKQLLLADTARSQDITPVRGIANRR